MKLYPNNDKTKIYVRSMRKMLAVTAIFDSIEDANNHMKKSGNNDGVVAETGRLILLADVYDPGEKVVK